MSTQSNEIKDVLHRAMEDEEFLDKFRTDPDKALGEYDLSEEDEEALKSGIDEKVRDHIDDQRADTVFDNAVVD